MARLPRLLVAGYPLHLIQRGHNRERVFRDDEDRRHYLEWLKASARENELAVHAWVLMDNHVHLLATPKSIDGLSRCMQSLGRRYTQYFNHATGRTGTLWEGRFKSCPIESERYLMACSRYIELNPVRAGMVEQPEDYRWSSYRHHVGIEAQPWMSDHPLYWALGNTPFERQSAYRALVAEGVGREECTRFTESAVKGWALGSEAFLKALSAQTGRRPSPLPKGRPRLTPTTDD